MHRLLFKRWTLAHAPTQRRPANPPTHPLTHSFTHPPIHRTHQSINSPIHPTPPRPTSLVVTPRREHQHLFRGDLRPRGRHRHRCFKLRGLHVRRCQQVRLRHCRGWSVTSTESRYRFALQIRVAPTVTESYSRNRVHIMNFKLNQSQALLIYSFQSTNFNPHPHRLNPHPHHLDPISIAVFAWYCRCLRSGDSASHPCGVP